MPESTSGAKQSRDELIDATAAKIVLSISRGDSINRVANKTGTSYSWTYDWIERLGDTDIIASTDSGLRVVDHEMRQQYADVMAAVYSRSTVSQEDAYIVPHFAGMEFAYTEIDAAYVWTHGGYQIARSHDDYPVFLDVHDRDVERWIAFFQRFGVDVTVGERPDGTAVDSDVHYVLLPQTDGISTEWVDGNPVVPLDEAVAQMMQNRPAYEPALEMIADEYDVEIDAHYHSATTGD
jgi:hypothetical protein